MPELAEVETVRRTLERVLKTHSIQAAEVPEDSIVLKGHPAKEIEELVIGAKVISIGRKGKFWWIELENRPFLCGHLGMAGWVRELGAPSIRLKEHGKMPFDDENGRPRFLKMLLQTEEGKRVALTDGRRLARIWIAADPLKSKPIAQLGPDMYLQPYSGPQLHAILSRRKAPLKALLLDQKLFAGIGNWVADEVLYQARIHPKRLGTSVTLAEAEAMVIALATILQTAVDCGADEHKFPKDWMFHARWGGKRGSDTLNGHAVEREQVGGRTTAWIPDLQKL